MVLQIEISEFLSFFNFSQNARYSHFFIPLEKAITFADFLNILYNYSQRCVICYRHAFHLVVFSVQYCSSIVFHLSAVNLCGNNGIAMPSSMVRKRRWRQDALLLLHSHRLYLYTVVCRQDRLMGDTFYKNCLRHRDLC